MKVIRNMGRTGRRRIGLLAIVGVVVLAAAACQPEVGSAPSGTAHFTISPSTVSIDSHATGAGPIPAGPGYGTASVQITNDGTGASGGLVVAMDSVSGTGTWSANLTFGYCSSLAVGATCMATVKYTNNTAAGTGTATFHVTDGSASASAAATGHGVT